MSTQAINSNLLARLKDKKYRDTFIASQINRIIPFQIRALRAARDNMTQEELAERAETTQSVISRIQNKGAANLNIKSLLKLASAFDVALVVRFEPIDRFIDWVDDLSPEVMSPKPSEVVLAEIEGGAREAGVTPAATRGAVIDAEHLFPGPPVRGTSTHLQFLPGIAYPMEIATPNRQVILERRVTAVATAPTETVSAGNTKTHKVAGGSY